MGASDDDTDAYPDEKPQHEVVLKNRFAIGKYLVTVAEFNHFCSEKKRIYPKTVEGCCEKCPVTNISWCDAVEYVNWLSEKTSKKYRLPTEAEWEYCCRADTTTRFYFGDKINEKHVNFKVGDEVGRPTKVGSFPPNRWGIHDMHGNVWEYVADSWHETYENAPADGSAWIDSAEIQGSTVRKVVRGGSFSYAERDNRSSERCFYEFKSSDDQHGFRVARSL